jgi:uncharacterized membrane protein
VLAAHVVRGKVAVASGPAAPARSRRSFVELEERLTGRLLAWVGGIALVLGGVFFLSLAFNRGWIGPEARVLVGLVASAAALGAGAWLFERRLGTPALALVGVGVAVGMLAVYAATALYGFVPAEAGLVVVLVIALGAAVIAVRADSEVVAALGLLAVLGAPPVLAAPATLFTVLFVGVALVGTTGVTIWRSWGWLPGLAFLLSAPQVAVWLASDPPTALALGVVALYWALNALAAGGDALFLGRRNVHVAAAPVLALNALFAIMAIRGILVDASPVVRTGALLLLAVGHVVLILPLTRRPPAERALVVLGLAAGVATLVVTVALEFGSVFQPIAWAAIAVALAWTAFRWDNAVAGAGAAVTAAPAVLHLVLVEYPVSRAGDLRPTGLPFVSEEGTVLACLVAAVLVVTVLGVRWAAGRVQRRPSPQMAAAVGGLAAAALVAYAAPFELFADETVALWSLLAAAAFVGTPRLYRDRDATATAFAGGAVLVVLGIIVMLVVVAPLSRLGVEVVPPVRDAVPLLNPETAALVALAGALIVAARTAPRDEWSIAAAVAAGSIATYTASIAIVDAFQAQVPGAALENDLALQAQVAVSISWVVGGAVAFALGLARHAPFGRMFGLGLLSLATAKVFLFDLAALDVAYRVLSLIGLGVVLLATSLLVVRARGRGPVPERPGATGDRRRTV